MMKLRMLQWVDYSWLSEYLLNTVTNIFVKTGRGIFYIHRRREGKVATKAEIGVIEPYPGNAGSHENLKEASRILP